MNPAIDYYEKIIDKIIIRAVDFYGAESYRNFRHKDSLHSFTTAFGLPAQRLACFCSESISAEFQLSTFKNNPNRKSRFLLKLIATWLDWKKLQHRVKILVNDNIIFDQKLFLENVCIGWPAVYIPIPLEYIRKGKNHLQIINFASEENTLLINQAEIIRQTDMVDFTIQSYPNFAIKNQTFNISLVLLKQHSKIKISYPKDKIKFLQRKDNVFTFLAKKCGNNITIQFLSGGNKCKGIIEDIYDEKGKRKVYVGLNCDDIRHDESGEMERVLANIAHTQIGNYIAFRAEENRTHTKETLAVTDTWRKSIQFCLDNNLFFQFSTFGTSLPPMSLKEIQELSGNRFLGIQLHEPYSIFQPLQKVPAPPYIKKAKNLLEKKNAYIRYIDVQCKKYAEGKFPVFFGDPSLLCSYQRDTLSAGIFCEAVSNSSLLFGAARGTGKTFGAHIAADWYFGSRHNESALRRFKMMLYLAYSAGCDYITVESTLFKTNAFTREDWEDDFCRSARNIMREFYRFTCQDRRRGRPVVPLGIIYGNLESMFWMPDDRIPELIDTSNWDDLVWGKWNETDYRWLWRVAEAWLSLFGFKHLGRDEWLTKMFNGTPYGQVNLVLPDSELSQYKSAAFVGWNTMTKKIYDNLVNYVRTGGILFICGCHLDTRVNLAEKTQLFKDGNVKKLIGANISGTGEKIFGKFRTCRLKDISATQIEPHLFEYKNGKGTVYFFNFYDYPTDVRLINRIKDILKKIGNKVSDESAFKIEGKNSTYINYTLWENGKSHKVYLTNIDWESKASKRITVRYNNKRYFLRIKDGETVAIDMDMLS